MPIRRTFVQQKDGRGYVGGPLKSLVLNHDEHALDQYLLLHAKASGGDWAVTLEAAVWARLMGRDSTSTGLTSISKGWNRLSRLHLIETTRSGRKAKVSLLCEDGSGDPYTRPRGVGDDRWFHLPYEYWTDGWFQNLKLPAKAVLLIALSLQDGFVLPLVRAGDWYGISRNTAQRGMQELVDHSLIDKVEQWEEEDLSAIGHRLVVNYTLRPPFGPQALVAAKRAQATLALKSPAKKAASTRLAARKSAVKKGAPLKK